MGTGNLQAFLNDERVQVVGLCDVDRGRLEAALKIASLEKGAGTGDFRELLAREDVDAVMIATPDHWHAYIAAAAARAGKDLYSEKPLAASVAEGRRLSDIVRAEKRVLQCGTWRRSSQHTRRACELVRNGVLGELRRVEVGVPAAFQISGGYTGLEEPEAVPDGFDYEMWTGPAPEAPYTAARCHFNFRWVDAYAPGYITDWGAHFLDVAQWGMGTDDTGPVEVQAEDVRRRERGIYDAAEGFRIRYAYASGVEVVMRSTAEASEWGTRFVGSEGWIFSENDKLAAQPENLLRAEIPASGVRLYESNNHHRNFIDGVVSRAETASPVEAAHRAASVCHLGAIAAKLGRALRFDPQKETFPGDDEANALLARPMREPWSRI
jgi:predicted dehydrogenase